MKKTLLFRLFAIALFGLVLIVLKSDACCNGKFNCNTKKNVQSETLKQPNQFPPFPPEEGFLIKI